MKQAIAGTLLLAGVLSLASAPSGQVGPKILLLCDMEGVTGVTNAEDVNFGSASYSAARESLTEDVNAAVRGLLIGGASEVVLTDGHGSGNPEPDYLLDRLPKRSSI